MLVNKRNLRVILVLSFLGFLTALYLSRQSLTGVVHQAQQHFTASTSSTHAADASSEDVPAAQEDENADKAFLFDKWFFEADQGDFALPTFDARRLKTMTPRNWQGPGRPTFATYYASREATLHNPYFLGAQQIVYRLLWDQQSRTHKYPVTVFVAPFVDQVYRDYFAAAGAVVTELPLTLHHPNGKQGVAGRLIDMFSKLRMWDQEQYSRIAYMDCDAFPLVNIDDIFDTAHEQTCREELLSDRERESTSGLCDYVFTGHGEMDGSSVNAGVMVFKPNAGLGEFLLRDSEESIDKYDNGLMEQSFVNWFFRRSGPFPWEDMPGEYNGSPDYPEKGLPVAILHAKLWALWDKPEDWTYDMFNKTWLEMLHLYNSDEFIRLREEDDRQAAAGYA